MGIKCARQGARLISLFNENIFTETRVHEANERKEIDYGQLKYYGFAPYKYVFGVANTPRCVFIE